MAFGTPDRVMFGMVGGVIRLVVAEDSLLVREGIVRLLSAYGDVEIAGIAVDLPQLLAAVDEHTPNVVLTDIRMPPSGTDEGIRAAAELRARHPDVGVVVLSQYVEPGYALSLFDGGSQGRAYLLKERLSEGSQLIDAIRAVHRNSNATRRPIAQIVGQSMVHDIHSARFISGEEIVSVHAFGAGAANDSFRHILAVCQFQSGAHAMLEFDDAGFAYEVTVEVLCAEGDVLTGAPVRAVRRRNGSVDTYIGPDWFAWFAEAYRIQDQAWVASIRAGKATGPSTWDGLAAHHVVEAIIQSLSRGESVAVEPLDKPSIY